MTMNNEEEWRGDGADEGVYQLSLSNPGEMNRQDQKERKQLEPQGI